MSASKDVSQSFFYLAQKQIVELLSQEEPTREICQKISKYCKSYLVRQNITVMGERNGLNLKYLRRLSCHG